MLKIVVLVSGGGTNLQAIMDGIKEGTISNTFSIPFYTPGRKFHPFSALMGFSDLL